MTPATSNEADLERLEVEDLVRINKELVDAAVAGLSLYALQRTTGYVDKTRERHMAAVERRWRRVLEAQRPGSELVTWYGRVWWEWLDADGKLHREDGPAIERFDGRLEWYVHGKRHRDDGPAVEWPDGRREWFKNGHRIPDPEGDLGTQQLADGAVEP